MIRIALLASLLLAAPALANDDQKNSAKPAKEKKICKTSGDRTESRMPRRVCKTASEWESERGNDAGDDIERISN